MDDFTVDDFKLKLIECNAARYKVDDDPSYPYKLELVFHPFNDLCLVQILLGRDVELVIVVRGMSRQVLDCFLMMNDYLEDEWTRSLVLTGPEGVLQEVHRPPPT